MKREEVKKALIDFEELLINALGWDNELNYENRSNLGRKFDLLKDTLKIKWAFAQYAVNIMMKQALS